MITATKQIATQRLVSKISQIGTDNPFLENTLVNTFGTLTLTRLAAGQYIIQRDAGEAPQGFDGENLRINGIIDGATPIGLSVAAFNDNFVQFAVAGTNITMDVKNAAGVRVELSSLGGGFISIPINIEMYNNPQTI